MRGRVIFVTVLSLFAWGCSQVECVPSKSEAAVQSYTSADVVRALNDARRFAGEGKYEAAVERHVWYHKNALKYEPAQYGVRLSYALSYWSELGKLYPKALDPLRSIRDETLAAYRATPSDSLLFWEVMSINFALDDLQAAKALFYEGRKKGIAASIGTMSLERIMAAGEMQWARDAIGDPKKCLEGIKQSRSLMLSTMSTREDSKQFNEALDEGYASQIATLVQVVAKTDGLAAARAVQKDALRFLDSPLIRNALKGE